MAGCASGAGAGRPAGLRRAAWPGRLNRLTPEQVTALPAEFQAMFRTVRDTYDDMATAFEQAILDNVKKAMDIGVQCAERAYWSICS